MDNKNEQQIGSATYVVKRVFTKDTHQALVSQEQFDLAAHFMGENTKAFSALTKKPPSIQAKYFVCKLHGSAFLTCFITSKTGGWRLPASRESHLGPC